jgi:AraC-like DNA-binding protein
VSRAIGPRTARAPGATYARRRLVDRVKVLLASDLSRRWTLAEIAAEIGGSAVYLTQVFQQVEGVPLYATSCAPARAGAPDHRRREDLSGVAQDGLLQPQPFLTAVPSGIRHDSSNFTLP